MLTTCMSRKLLEAVALLLVCNGVIAWRHASRLSEAKAAPLQWLAEHHERVLNFAKTLCFGAWARPDKQFTLLADAATAAQAGCALWWLAWGLWVR